MNHPKINYIFSLLTALFFANSIFAHSAYSQTNPGSITGKVVDATSGEPLDFASVALVNNVDKKTVKAGQTDLEGNFRLSTVPVGVYTLRVSFVGYKPFAQNPVNVTEGSPIISLGTIKLSSSNDKLWKENAATSS